MRMKKQCGGFTLVEMLVVIGIIGILATTLMTSFSRLKTTARQAQAQAQAAEVAAAFTVYLQRYREWPETWKNGTKTEMDEEVCWEFQKRGLLDLTTYKYSNGSLMDCVSANSISTLSLDRFGMLDPWGRIALKKTNTQSSTGSVRDGGTFADHRIQFRLDRNYDGYVDSGEGAPKGMKVRAAAIVWSRGPDGKDAASGKVRYPGDDRLSWPYGQVKGDQ